MLKLLKFLIRLGAMIAIALVAFGFLSSFHPAFDAISNLRWHISVALLLFFLLAMIFMRFRLALVALIAGITGIVTTIPTHNPLEKRASGVELSIVSFNLLYNNGKKQKTIDMLLETNADILNLMETSREWAPFLDQLKENWPFQRFCPSLNRVGGITIFSRYPMVEGVKYCKEDGSLSIAAIELEDEDIVIGAVHLNWPWPWKNSTQIEEMREILESVPQPAIFTGDFNSASWTENLSRFARYGGLIHDRTVAGSWILQGLPVNFAPFVGLRIDHVLHKGELKLRELAMLNASGSDHLPLQALFVIPDPEEATGKPKTKEK